MKKTECSNCGKNASVNRGKYHFKECGLQNVMLDGIEVISCDNCGNIDPIIPRFNDLMRTLALAVIVNPARLSGAEIKFLRKYLKMTGEQFAQLLSVDKTTLSKWETNADQVGAQSDKLIRAIVALKSKELQNEADELLLRFQSVSKKAMQADTICLHQQNHSYQYAYASC